jgi:hypothetical protein
MAGTEGRLYALCTSVTQLSALYDMVLACREMGVSKYFAYRQRRAPRLYVEGRNWFCTAGISVYELFFLTKMI